MKCFYRCLIASCVLLDGVNDVDGVFIDAYHICICPAYTHLWSHTRNALVSYIQNTYPESQSWFQSHSNRFGVSVSLFSIMNDLCNDNGWLNSADKPTSLQDMARIACGLFTCTKEEQNIIKKLKIKNQHQQHRLII